MTRILFSMIAALTLIASAGCMDRQIAPELPSSPDEVEKIKENVDNFDW